MARESLQDLLVAVGSAPVANSSQKSAGVVPLRAPAQIPGQMNPTVQGMISVPMIGNGGMSGGPTREEKVALDELRLKLQKQLGMEEATQQQFVDFTNKVANQVPNSEWAPAISGAYQRGGVAPAEAEAMALKGSRGEAQKTLQEALKNQIGAQDRVTDSLTSLLNHRLGVSNNNAMMRGMFGEERQQNEMFTKMGKELNENLAARGSVLGSSAQALANINKAKALATSVSDPNKLIPQQVAELEEALGRIVSGASQTSEGRLNHLRYDTMARDFAGMKQWLLNHPTDAKAGQYVNMVMHMLEREAGVMNDLVNKSHERTAQTYGPLLLSSPRHALAVKAMWRQAGLDENGKAIPTTVEPSTEELLQQLKGMK